MFKIFSTTIGVVRRQRLSGVAAPLRLVVQYTHMCRLATGIRSGKCVVKRFRRRGNATECTYTNLVSTV